MSFHTLISSAHAYQILRAGGLDPDHIITMMYNDVPYDPLNPFPGELYNYPGDSPNVYEGIVIDYEGEDVTPENLIKVLLGDESTGKKVLKSTETDNIFFYYSDHGAPDLLAMPVDTSIHPESSGYLYSDDLYDAVVTMHDKRMYNKFVFYIEACYSGSMFMNYPTDLNVVAVTAANPDESSYAEFCGSDAVVKDVYLDTCLSDEFSNAWMHHVDETQGQATETLEQQFEYLVNTVMMSEVSQYGDLSFQDDVIGEFIGYPTRRNRRNIRSRNVRSTQKWDSRDNKLLFLQFKANRTTGAEHDKWIAEVSKELERRRTVEAYFHSLTSEPSMFRIAKHANHLDCYKRAIAQFEKDIGYSDYALKYYDVLANMCNANPNAF